MGVQKDQTGGPQLNGSILTLRVNCLRLSGRIDKCLVIKKVIDKKLWKLRTKKYKKLKTHQFPTKNINALLLQLQQYILPIVNCDVKKNETNSIKKKKKVLIYV